MEFFQEDEDLSPEDPGTTGGPRWGYGAFGDQARDGLSKMENLPPTNGMMTGMVALGKPP